MKRRHSDSHFPQRPTQSSQRSSSSQQLKVFLVWLRSTTAPFNSLFNAIVREVCLYIGSGVIKLATYQCRRLWLFDVESETWSQSAFARGILQDDEMQLAPLSNSSVFCCGGVRHLFLSRTHTTLVKSQKSACVLRITGQITTLPTMHQERTLHGLFLHSQSAFVFAGERLYRTTRVRLQSCEEYSFSAGTWTALPDLSVARKRITPCLWSQEIYICGGARTACVEALSLLSRSFRSLPFRLPAKSPTMSWVGSSGELVVVQERKVTVIREVRSGVEVRDLQQACAYTSATPARWQGKVYCIDQHCVVVLDEQSLEKLRTVER